MPINRAVLGATALVAIVAAATATPAAAIAPPTGDPVLYWNEVMITGGPFNPGQTRPAAMLNIAMHDAVNAALGRPNRAYLGYVANAGGDVRAAASVAARNVLANLYPARTAEFDAALAVSLALVPDGAAKSNGIATGAAMAAATIARRATDGSFDVVPYTPSGLPGRWAQTIPGPPTPVNQQQATVDPWVIASGDQFRSGPPPVLTSLEYTAAFNEVKAIGSATSVTRTADQTAAALFWEAATGPGPYMRAAIDLAQSHGLSTIDTAALMARLSTASGDAAIAAWDNKVLYDYWRPVTAIRGGAIDGNPDTDADAGWNSLINAPPHQSYISAHAIVSGAMTTILGETFGDTTAFCIAAGIYNRCWDSFSGAALDSANSRLWGGIHWRFDNEAGLLSGRQLGQYIWDSKAFDAVPEPSSWVMLIAGFGLTGAVMRRRARTVSA